MNWNTIVALWNAYYAEYDRTADDVLTILQSKKHVGVTRSAGVNDGFLTFEQTPKYINVTYLNGTKSRHTITEYFYLYHPRLMQRWKDIKTATVLYMSEQETAFTDSFNRQLLQHGINTNIKILKTTGEWSTASGIDDNSDSERITIRQNFRGACLQISNNGTIHYLTVMRELMFGESQLYFYPNKEGLNGINLFRDVSHHQIESYHKLQAITGDHLGTFGLIVNSLIHV